MKKLKTIEEYNDERREAYNPSSTAHKTGVACPKCGEEVLSNLTITLTSYPPQVYVKCPKCQWRGTIIQ